MVWPIEDMTGYVMVVQTISDCIVWNWGVAKTMQKNTRPVPNFTSWLDLPRGNDLPTLIVCRASVFGRGHCYDVMTTVYVFSPGPGLAENIMSTKRYPTHTQHPSFRPYLPPVMRLFWHYSSDIQKTQGDSRTEQRCYENWYCVMM